MGKELPGVGTISQEECEIRESLLRTESSGISISKGQVEGQLSNERGLLFGKAFLVSILGIYIKHDRMCMGVVIGRYGC